MNAERIAGLQRYLQIHVQIREEHRESMIAPEWHYSGMEDFVLKEGKIFWEISPDHPGRNKKNRYQPRFMKACFDNAYKAALASKGHLRYVEGYANGRLIPVHHAWNSDREGRIVDTTWWGEGRQYDNPPVGEAYIGVEFPVEYVRSLRNDKNLCVIDQWELGWPVLCTPYDKLLQEVAA